MKNKIIAFIMVLVMIFSFASCSGSVNTDTVSKFSMTEQAEIKGDLKGALTGGEKCIEILFPEKTTFNTVTLVEKDLNIAKFSIKVKNDNGEFVTVYTQDSIGEYRYCEIGEHTSNAIQICVESVTENEYLIKEIDVLNVQNNKNKDFRVTSYIVCPTFYSAGEYETEKLSSITDVILFGIARFDENGNVYLQDSEINGEAVSGDKIFRDIIEGLRKVNPEIKIHCNALGPDGVDADNKEALHSQAFIENGEALSNNIVALLNEYDFDGFFFDYEYPYKKSSKKDYSKFLVQLDSKMGDYILGASLSHWNCDLSKDAIKALDRVEIMAYDDMSGRTHSDFAAYGGALSILSFEGEGYDLSKCDLGLPFYGRTHNGEEAWPSYAQIVPDLGGDLFNNTVKKSYMPNATDEVYTSFNSVQMIKDKTAFANDFGVGGVMIWHYSCDVAYESEMSLFKAIQTALETRN